MKEYYKIIIKKWFWELSISKERTKIRGKFCYDNWLEQKHSPMGLYHVGKLILYHF